MKTTHSPKRITAGAPLAAGLATAEFGLAAGIAQAQPGSAPISHFTWCPGHPDPNDHLPGGPVPATQQARWDVTTQEVS
jgi:hypothetical protein